eukprot:6583004-Pyramimonas_sp.AAC.1
MLFRPSKRGPAPARRAGPHRRPILRRWSICRPASDGPRAACAGSTACQAAGGGAAAASDRLPPGGPVPRGVAGIAAPDWPGRAPAPPAPRIGLPGRGRRRTPPGEPPTNQNKPASTLNSSRRVK